MDISETGSDKSGITRGELGRRPRRSLHLERSWAAGAAASPQRANNAAASRPLRWPAGIAGMNQYDAPDRSAARDRALPWWLQLQRNMPGVSPLLKNGTPFKNAVTNTCMCSPVRSTYNLRAFPGSARGQVHAQVRHVLRRKDRRDGSSRSSFKPTAIVVLARCATCLSTRGRFIGASSFYGLMWKPSKRQRMKYGFMCLYLFDAVKNQSVSEEGVCIYDSDGCFMHSRGSPVAGTEGAVEYLHKDGSGRVSGFSWAGSLVNPDDVLLIRRRPRTMGR